MTNVKNLDSVVREENRNLLFNCITDCMIANHMTIENLEEACELVRSDSSGEHANPQKNETLYEEMVADLSMFVIRTANKDNPTDAEVNAMIEGAKMLFRTI